MTRPVSPSPARSPVSDTRVGRAVAATGGAASPLLIGIALGIVYVVWGSTYLAIRIMVEDMPPLVGAGLATSAASRSSGRCWRYVTECDGSW